jgi:glycosyltransferase involved in cell wall biosynthesis
MNDSPVQPLAQRSRVVVVTPVYNEELGLEEYRQAVDATLFSSTNAEFRVVFVDDGSRDASWRIIERMCREDPRYTGIRLSRNYGPHIALSAGIDHADADAVCTLACDLQDPPDVLLGFVEKWKQGADIVWGKRRTRDERSWRVWSSRLFAYLVRRYAMPTGSLFTTGSFLLMDRRVVEAFRQFRERNRIVFALVAWTGFDQAVVEYDRQARRTGASGWTFRRMMHSMYDTFIAFSNVPAKLITFAGAGMFFLSFLVALYLLLSWLLTDVVPGWTGIMMALTVLFGLNFLMLGMVGEYLSRIYAESTDRPLYFVSRRLGESADTQRADPSR